MSLFNFQIRYGINVHSVFVESEAIRYSSGAPANPVRKISVGDDVRHCVVLDNRHTILDADVVECKATIKSPSTPLLFVLADQRNWSHTQQNISTGSKITLTPVKLAVDPTVGNTAEIELDVTVTRNRLLIGDKKQTGTALLRLAIA